MNSGHGHVWPRTDGVKARCGGPALCRHCARDLANKQSAAGRLPASSGEESMTHDAYSTKRVTVWREDHEGELGYAIKYQDGYMSWCPKAIYERDYQPITSMSFGHAIAALKAGQRVARAGWNGKGMWLALSGPNGPREIAYENFWSKHASEYARLNGGSAAVLPCIIMKTAPGEILMGWLASQTDMLADDWMIVEPA